MDISLIVKLNAILGIFTFCTSITLIIYLTKIKDVETFKRVLPFVAGMVVVFLATVTVHIVLAVMKSQKHSQEQVSVETKPIGNLTDDCFIVTSEDYVLIDFSKSNSAEFGVVLGDSPVSDYANGFSFSCLDLNKNKVEKSPIEMTVVKAEKKTVGAQPLFPFPLKLHQACTT